MVHLLMELQPSGMERMLVSSAPHFGAHGVYQTIVAQGADHPFAEELRQAGYSVVMIPPVKTRAGRRAWARALQDRRPDVVHIHPEQAFSVAVLVAHRALPSARIVRTVHNFFNARRLWAVKRKLQLAASERFVDVTVFLNEDMAAHESSFGRSGVVIGNWVDDTYLTAERPSSPEFDVLIVGNCHSVKNHLPVLKAALENSWTVAHLGDEGAAPREEADMLSALESQGLLVARGVADPLPWLVRAAVFAMPSSREGFPVALAEAIATGCVCVVADIAGTHWAEDYSLVRMLPADSVETWGEAIRTALTLSTKVGGDEREQQRAAAREVLSAVAGVERYLEVYAPTQPR